MYLKLALLLLLRLAVASHSDLGEYRHKQINPEKGYNLQPQRSDQGNQLENHKSDDRRYKAGNKFNKRQSDLRRLVFYA